MSQKTICLRQLLEWQVPPKCKDVQAQGIHMLPKVMHKCASTQRAQKSTKARVWGALQVAQPLCSVLRRVGHAEPLPLGGRQVRCRLLRGLQLGVQRRLLFPAGQPSPCGALPTDA